MNRLCISFFAVLALASPTLLRAVDPSAALAEYVVREDDSYEWKVRREGKVAGTDYTELILTSQTWREITWKHQLYILNPASVAPDTKHALLFIAGGRWRDNLADPAGDEKLPGEARLLAAVAEQLKTPIAILLQVPHQPIFDGKYEDQIIAYTFDEYLKTGDTDWPLLLPMVKSAVRGMDATQELAKQKWSLNVDTFTVTGASKRGWTTWLTGAVDKRVTAIAPMVIDVLNMAPQMRHQKEAWGEVSYQINDYSKRGLTEKLQSDGAIDLRKIVDPYSYRKALKQPKLIMIGTNDHYWPIDALNLYWKDLVGPKYILYVPNNRHGLKDYGRVVSSLSALHQHAVTGEALPDLNWSFASGDGRLALEVRSDIKPQKVDAWIATSKTRDFREAKWVSRPIKRAGGAFRYELAAPDEGFVAIFAEAVYDGKTLPYFLSTNVRILGVSKAVE